MKVSLAHLTVDGKIIFFQQGCHVVSSGQAQDWQLLIFPGILKDRAII